MKKLALLILTGISLTTAKAQFQFGAKAGINFNTLGGSDAGAAKNLVGVNLGFYARLPLQERLSLQPEMLYSTQGADYSNASVHLNYLNIPILLRYNAGAGFGIYTGPQIGFLLSAHNKANGNSINMKDYYKSGDFAWAVGLNYRIPETKLGIDARYNFGIANVEDREAFHRTGSVRTSSFQLGLTYLL
ncbi:MAG: PorT family protein, partial [Bacteroidetes bacterium]|nr:PorT family protein [Bacteroidota bacterium]